MPHIARVGARLALAAVFVTACTGSEESRAAREAADAAESATLAASADTAGEFRVSNVMIGRRIGPGNRIIEPTFEFAPRDTIHISVGTEGAGERGMLTTAWRAQTGEIVEQATQQARPPGENTAFQLSQAKGLKPGTYKVIVFLGDDSVDTKVFVVKK